MSLQDVLILFGWAALFAAGGTLYHHRVAVSGFVMSWWGVNKETPNGVVYRPVDATSIEGQTSAVKDASLASPDVADLADIDAENDGLGWEPPRVSRFLTDDEFIVFLATQKLRNGKYRMSANDVVKTSHGDRNHVLSLVRQVRETTAAQYPARTPEQQAAREALGLPSQ